MDDLCQLFNYKNDIWLYKAFIGGLLSSIIFGIIGTYIITRRISYIAGAIAHASLGGIGFALYISTIYNITWLTPAFGAILTAFLATGLLSFAKNIMTIRSDTWIGAIWSLGMASGVILIAKTPGYHDPMNFLFGNILLINNQDMWLIIIMIIITLLIFGIFYTWIVAFCFDSEFAKLRNIPVNLLEIILLFLVALSIVMLTRIAGIALVIALFTLPSAIAGMFVKQLWQMMVLSIIFCILFVTTGIIISYIYDTITGPTIIIVGGNSFLIATVLRFFIKKVKFILN